MAQGSVRRFSEEKGYGLISPDEEGEDLKVVHYCARVTYVRGGSGQEGLAGRRERLQGLQGIEGAAALAWEGVQLSLHGRWRVGWRRTAKRYRRGSHAWKTSVFRGFGR